MGIDYGRGLTNIDHETGIRYGVISSHELGQAWYESAEDDYGDPYCPECGNKAVGVDDQPETCYRDRDDYECRPGSCGDYACDTCKTLFDADYAFGDTPVEFRLEDDEYLATQRGDDTDIFVLKSPYFTLCEFCSPCAPGAGYLLSEGSVRAYCFGHELFWDNQEHPHRAPYKVYRVEDSVELVIVEEDVTCDLCNGSGRDSLSRIAEVRKVPLLSLSSDVDLLARLIAEFHFDAATGTFDCYNCHGKGTKLTYVEKEVPQEFEDGSGTCPRCGKSTTILDETKDGQLIGDCETPDCVFTREEWLELSPRKTDG